MPLDQIDVDKELMKKENEMSFLDHLEELRWHLIRSVGAVLVFTIIAFIFKDFVFGQIILGPMRSDFGTYQVVTALGKWMGIENFVVQPPDFKFEARELGELFLTHLKASVFLGFIVAFPYVFWELWRFIKPGLYDKEVKAARGLVFVCSMLFFAGVSFGYYIIAPFAVNFFGNYEIADVVMAPSLVSYVNYMVMFTLPTGLLFELPVAVYFLSKIGVVTPEGMRKYRKHAFVVILIGAAIITPPDVMTQLLIGVPLYFLYESSILISKRVNDNYKKRFNNE